MQLVQNIELQEDDCTMKSIATCGTKHHYDSGLAEGSWKGMKKDLEQNRLHRLFSRSVH